QVQIRGRRHEARISRRTGAPVARSVAAVGDWWSLLIVRDAFTGKKRFDEFRKSLGVAKNILTGRLKERVADGAMELVPAADGSAYREYAVTEKGRGQLPVIVARASGAARARSSNWWTARGASRCGSSCGRRTAADSFRTTCNWFPRPRCDPVRI